MCDLLRAIRKKNSEKAKISLVLDNAAYKKAVSVLNKKRLEEGVRQLNKKGTYCIMDIALAGFIYSSRLGLFLSDLGSIYRALEAVKLGCQLNLTSCFTAAYSYEPNVCLKILLQHLSVIMYITLTAMMQTLFFS
ncbi:MAG: hypothetical protein AB8C84_12195 [Oligoflexales bacterium]